MQYLANVGFQAKTLRFLSFFETVMILGTVSQSVSAHSRDCFVCALLFNSILSWVDKCSNQTYLQNVHGITLLTLRLNAGNLYFSWVFFLILKGEFGMGVFLPYAM